MNILKINIYIIVSVLFVFLLSCDKSTTHIFYDDMGQIKDTTNINNLNLYFSADIQYSIENQLSYSPIQLDRYTHIFVYKKGSTPLDDSYYAMAVLKCEKEGTLTNIGWQFTLPRGVYNLYSAGANFEGVDQGPNFYNGLASGLSQDVDYIWWSKLNVSVTEDNTLIPMTYINSCAKIVINFSAAAGSTLSSVTHVDITLGNTAHCNMSLITGYISPSKAISNNKTMMHLDGLSAFVVSLPISTSVKSKYLTATIQATVNNKTSYYTLKVPLPSTNYSFTGGNEYVYSAVFNDDGTGYGEEGFIATLESVSPR